MTAILTGSPIFWILAALGITALVVFFERLLDLRRSQIDWHDFLKGVINVLESGNENEALSICADTPVPVANVAATAIRNRGGSLSALREAVDANGRSEVSRLERRIAVLSVIGHIAPLLGLLGTIIGFMNVILLINGSEIVPRSELVNAAFSTLSIAAMGLAVAIPVTVMDAMLHLRLDRIVSDLEAAATEIVNFLQSKGGVK